jgi:hypothetical protein
MSRLWKGAGVTAVAVAATFAAAAPASAAPQTQQLTCDGQLLTIRTPTENSSDNGGWSVGQIIAGGTGHLIPTSFAFSAYDVTTQTSLFSGTQYKGNGQANHNQQTVTCTQTQTGTLADLLGPGETPPPGVNLTDIVTTTITVTAVPKP